MPEKTIYAAVGAGAAATFAFLKGSHSSKKGHKALDKRVSQIEQDVRTCFGTNREQYVNKEVCIVRSSAVEDKVKEISEDTKELQVGQGKMAIQLAEIHAVFCKDKRNEEGG